MSIVRKDGGNMPKKDRVNMKQSKSKRTGKKHGAILHKKRLTAASAAHQEETMLLNKQGTDVGTTLSDAATSLASLNESLKRIDGKQAQQSSAIEAAANRNEELTSKPSNHSEKHYRKLYNACAKSKHLAGKLTQQRSGLQLTLPASLPSSLIFRALNKEANRYKELSANRIATREEHAAQLELIVDGMREDQMTKLIEELDQLIGEFTGRS